MQVDAIAGEMRDRLAPLAESAGIELVADVAPAEVVIPRKRLEQLIVNLVRNALRAVQAGGGSRIAIFVRPEGGRGRGRRRGRRPRHGRRPSFRAPSSASTAAAQRRRSRTAAGSG